MRNVAIGLAALMCCSAPASAALASRTSLRSLTKGVPATLARTTIEDFVRGSAANPGRPRFRITAETEVLLDGQPCAYTAIPKNAAITNIEVAADQKTVLRIHFQTQR